MDDVKIQELTIDNEALRNALRDILPLSKVSDPRENPLNLILPGFETMWRVVLRDFVELAYKTGKEHRNLEDSAHSILSRSENGELP